MATIVDWLVYGIGGGHGHARRAWLVQRTLREAGRRAVLLIRPGSDRYLPPEGGPRIHAESLADASLDDLRRDPPRGIVVDTFPRGWRGELDATLLGRFQRRIGLARYSRLSWNEGYDRIVSPYPAESCEWGGALPGARHAGYIVDAGHLRLASDGRTFAVVDSEGRCNARLLEILAAAARRRGLLFALHRRLDEPIRARKLLVVGAGYHSFYECLGSSPDVRFLPVTKAHDDQAARARRFGRALGHLDQLPPWLEADPAPPSRPARLEPGSLLDALR